MRPRLITWLDLAGHVRAVADETGFGQAVHIIADDDPNLRRAIVRRAFDDHHLDLIIPKFGQTLLPDDKAQQFHIRITRGPRLVQLALVPGGDERELSCWTVRALAGRKQYGSKESVEAMHAPTPTCSGICVLPPPCWHPILYAPKCPCSCPTPLGAYARAGDILLHQIAHPGNHRGAKPPFRLTREDQAKCLQFVQAEMPCRASSAEAALLLMDIERIAQVLAIQRQGPTLARIGDSVQQSFVLILSHLTQYDPSRAGFSTWVYDWAREAVEQEAKRGRFGYGFEAGNGRTASRLIEYLEAIENPRNGR
jgi:hypothetical protein